MDYTMHSDVSGLAQPIIRSLKQSFMYDLIDARMGHPGEWIMTQLRNHVEGTDKLQKPPLYKCHGCMLAKSTRQPVPQKISTSGIHREQTKYQEH